MIAHKSEIMFNNYSSTYMFSSIAIDNVNMVCEIGLYIMKQSYNTYRPLNLIGQYYYVVVVCK